MSVIHEFRRIEFQRGCGTKHKHASYGKAQAHIRSLVRRGLATDDELHVYRCAWCASFHVGHKRGHHA